mgnify:CR=1 FL=1
MKDAYYFSHDANAQNDPNIVKLLFKHGWSGYGLYWAIIEKLRNEPEYIMDTDYDMIAYALRTNSDLIESIIGDFNLFVIEKECFYSPSLKRRMGRLDEIKEKRVYAGKMSGISRNKAKPKQSLNKKGTGVEQVLNTKPTDEQLNNNHKPITNKKTCQIPYQLIVDAYHEILPELPSVTILSDPRKTKIKKLFNYICRLNYYRIYCYKNKQRRH